MTLKTDLSMKAEINLYYDLYVPENISQPAPLLIAIHGYGAHKRYMMREAQSVAGETFVVASLQAPYQHFRKTDAGYKVGFGWLTDFKPEESVLLHQQFILETIEGLTATGVVDAGAVFLYGFSQACALNFRFALTFPEILRGIVGISGGIPSDLHTNSAYKISDAAALYLYGDSDEFYSLEKFRLGTERLNRFFDNLETKEYSAAHEITDSMRSAVSKFLSQNRLR
jgi:phospholipase/carboxylesterase